MNKCYWKNGLNRLAECKVATKFSFIKNTVFVTCNKKRYVCKKKKKKKKKTKKKIEYVSISHELRIFGKKKS